MPSLIGWTHTQNDPCKENISQATILTSHRNNLTAICKWGKQPNLGSFLLIHAYIKMNYWFTSPTKPQLYGQETGTVAMATRNEWLDPNLMTTCKAYYGMLQSIF